MTSMKISELAPIPVPTGLEQTVVASNGLNRRVSLNAIKSLVNKTDIGLPAVDNTSDADKPLSTAVTTALSNKAALGHTHEVSDVVNLTASLASKANNVHIHAVSDIAGLQTTLDIKAAINHSHTIVDIPNLQSSLDNKSALGHLHQLSDTAGLVTALAGKAAVSDLTSLAAVVSSKADVTHNHVIADVLDLENQLGNKALAIDVNNLQTLVASKAWTNHTHVITDIHDLQTTLTDINSAIVTKQPLLTAGTNISILNNVISASSSGSITPVIVKPVITYPRNNDTNIVESSFLTAPYRNLYGYECAVVRWQIDSTAAFTNASEFILDGNSPSLIVNRVPPIDQYVRVQYEDIDGNVSAWSDTVKYTGAPYVLESIVTDFRLKSTSIKQTGFSTAISDDGLIAAIGSPAEDVDWIDETSTPVILADAGTVSIYIKTNGVWALEAKLIPPNPETGARFGHSVSMTSDGQAIVISAPYAQSGYGYICVYRRTFDGTIATWTQASYIENTGSTTADMFGLEVMFKPNGDTIFASGGSNESASYVSVLAVLGSGSWFELQKLFHNEEIKPLGFGRSMAISKDGNTLAVGSRHTDGLPDVNYWDPTISQIGSVTTSENGMYISVSVYKSEYGYGSSYILDAVIYPPYANGNNGSYTDTAFGWDLSLSDNGSVLAVGDPKLSTNSSDEGAVLFYKTDNLAIDIYTKYVLTSTLNNPLALPENKFFGRKISLQFNGQRLYVGNPSLASSGFSGIYAFENIFSKWEQVMTGLLADIQVSNSSNILFGSEFSISRDENSIIIASPNQADEELFICNINASRLFNPANPHVLFRPADSDLRYSGEFGVTLSISSDGKTLAVGYPDGLQSGFSNYLENLNDNVSSGKVYLFEKSLIDDRWFKSKATTTPGSLTLQSSNRLYNVITENEQYTSDNFGKSLALSGDGRTLAVTSKSSGLLYIYSRESSSWSKTKVFQTPPTLADFGKTVCVTEDGCTIAVSCSVRNDLNGIFVTMPKIAIFKKQNNVWTYAELIGPNEECLYINEVCFTLSPTGKSLAICYPVITNYAETAKKLVIYDRVGNSYMETKFIEPEGASYLYISNNPETSLSFSHNGELLAIGSPLDNEGHGCVNLYNYTAFVPSDITLVWKLQTVLNHKVPTNVINFGKVVSISHDAMALAVNSNLGIHIFSNRNSSKKERGNTQYPYSGLWEEMGSPIAPIGSLNAVGGVLADSIQLSGNGNALVFNDPSYLFSDPYDDYNPGCVRLFGTNIYSTVTLQSGSMPYNVANTNDATVNTLDIPITLQAGNVLEFGSDGIPGASFTGDTFIRLIDSSDNTVAFNDQNGNSNGSYLNITISNTGNYIMRIGAWKNEIDSGTVVWKVYSS